MAQGEAAQGAADRPPGGRVTLHAVILPGKKPRMQPDYREYIANLHKAFGHMAPDDVTKTQLYEYHEARCAPVRANREVSVLGSIYAYSIKWRAGTTNPIEGSLYAEEKARDHEVSLTELRKVNRDHAPQWLRVFCLLKPLTGLRQQDLLQIGKMNVDELRGLPRANIGKTQGQGEGHRVSPDLGAAHRAARRSCTTAAEKLRRCISCRRTARRAAWRSRRAGLSQPGSAHKRSGKPPAASDFGSTTSAPRLATRARSAPPRCSATRMSA